MNKRIEATAKLAGDFLKHRADVNGDGKVSIEDVQAAHEAAERHAAAFTTRLTPLWALVCCGVTCAVGGWFAHVGWVRLVAWWVK